MLRLLDDIMRRASDLIAEGYVSLHHQPGRIRLCMWFDFANELAAEAVKPLLCKGLGPGWPATYVGGLWIVRVSAGCAQNGITYSRFIAGLQRAMVELDRKTLSELAIADPAAFDQVIATAREHLPAQTA